MEDAPLNTDFINLTADNLASEHLCCIIRSRAPHPGVEEKRQWLASRIREGHVFRKLNAKGVVFIEYAPLETAWVPILGDNYYYIYCLWVSGSYKGKGYGKLLMEYCLADARKKGKSGVCMLGAEKQKAWLADNPLRRSSALRRWMLPAMAMNCLRFPLTAQRRGLRRMPKRGELRAGS